MMVYPMAAPVLHQVPRLMDGGYMQLVLGTLAVTVVDDNVERRGRVTDILRTQAHVRAVDGYAAAEQLFAMLDAHPTRTIDLILLTPPRTEDSAILLRRMRAHPQLEGAPVVALITPGMAADVTWARQSGFDGALDTPCDAVRLVDYVVRVMCGDAVWDRGAGRRSAPAAQGIAQRILSVWQW
jgi:two-component system, cell cycle response regulator DivK